VLRQLYQAPVGFLAASKVSHLPGRKPAGLLGRGMRELRSSAARSGGCRPLAVGEIGAAAGRAEPGGMRRTFATSDASRPALPSSARALTIRTPGHGWSVGGRRHRERRPGLAGPMAGGRDAPGAFVGSAPKARGGRLGFAALLEPAEGPSKRDMTRTSQSSSNSFGSGRAGSAPGNGACRRGVGAWAVRAASAGSLDGEEGHRGAGIGGRGPADSASDAFVDRSPCHAYGRGFAIVLRMRTKTGAAVRAPRR